MKSVKALAPIKPECADAPDTVKRDMEKYNYDLSFNMPSEEFSKYLEYCVAGYNERHLKRVREGREF